MRRKRAAMAGFFLFVLLLSPSLGQCEDLSWGREPVSMEKPLCPEYVGRALKDIPGLIRRLEKRFTRQELERFKKGWSTDRAELEKEFSGKVDAVAADRSWKAYAGYFKGFDEAARNETLLDLLHASLARDDKWLQYQILVLLCKSWPQRQGELLEKPALYLYPETDGPVYVTLAVQGALYKSIPEYGSGWFVNVTKKGTIDNEYDYLYYEASLDKEVMLKGGSWVVKRENLQDWFDFYLLRLGLNTFEAQQCKEYWLERLTNSPYYEIGLVDDVFLDLNVKLIIVPIPKTVIRVMLYFIPLPSSKDFVPPEVRVPLREGFTVVEWGGILAENPKRAR